MPLLVEIILGAAIFLIFTFIAQRVLTGLSKPGREGLFVLGAIVALLVGSPFACLSYILTPVVLSIGLRGR